MAAWGDVPLVYLELGLVRLDFRDKIMAGKEESFVDDVLGKVLCGAA